MKKHLFILGLALALFNVGCDDQNTIPNGYVQTTQEGASTLVLKGYENAALGFSVFQPEGFDSPFYIQDKKFAGNAYSFTQVAAARLDEMTTVPANVEWQSNATVTAGAAYWARYAASTVYRFVKFRVSDINGNNVTIEYVVTDQTEERPNDNVNANTGYDNVSVTKGGTLNKLLKNFKGTTVNGGTPTTDANGFTIHGLACPEYYFMAVLSQKDDVFHAIAFLVPHKEGMTRNPSSDELKEYVVSVDKLEEETGIDFFCNLPDVLENEVEAAYNLNDWAW